VDLTNFDDAPNDSANGGLRLGGASVLIKDD